jgi:DnaJ-domain-containing protein 1
MALLGDKATLNPGGSRPTARQQRRLPPTERRALEILDAQDTQSKSEIRRQYKALVKDLHPDLNGGRRDDEARLAEVVWAWEQIKASRSFPD